VIDRQELSGPAKPLARERWAGGVDSVGSTTLANLLSMTKYGGAIAACGLAAGMDLPASVAAVHFARRVSSRHRLGDVPNKPAQCRLGAPGPGSRTAKNSLKSLKKLVWMKSSRRGRGCSRARFAAASW